MDTTEDALQADGLLLRLVPDERGLVEIVAIVRAHGFSGAARAYFGLEDLRRFAEALQQLPLGPEAREGIRGGLLREPGGVEEIHVGIKVFETDGQGHLGCAVTLANPYLRPYRIEIIPRLEVAFASSYGPVADFGRRLGAAVGRGEGEAVLEADAR